MKIKPMKYTRNNLLKPPIFNNTKETLANISYYLSKGSCLNWKDNSTSI